MKFSVGPETESNLPLLKKLEEQIRGLYASSRPVSYRDLALVAWYALVPEAREAAAKIVEEYGGIYLDDERAAERIADAIRKDA